MSLGFRAQKTHELGFRVQGFRVQALGVYRDWAHRALGILSARLGRFGVEKVEHGILERAGKSGSMTLNPLNPKPL